MRSVVFLTLFLSGTAAAQPHPVIPATAEQRFAWARAIEHAKTFAVHHDQALVHKVDFPTRLPSERLTHVLHADDTVPADSALVALLAEALRDTARAREIPACRDSMAKDEITLHSGDLDAVFDPEHAGLRFEDGKNHVAYVGAGRRTAALLDGLVRALPDDIRLGALAACTTFVARKEDPPSAGLVYVESLPEAIERVPPDYPELVRESNIEGMVVVQALIGKNGEIQRTVVVRSIPLLDQAAVQAVEKWRFKPAMSNGKPVAVWVAIPVDFHLH